VVNSVHQRFENFRNLFTPFQLFLDVPAFFCQPCEDLAYVEKIFGWGWGTRDAACLLGFNSGRGPTFILTGNREKLEKYNDRAHGHAAFKHPVEC
jgi:hypothetical protein